jgi:hypothetical protein
LVRNKDVFEGLAGAEVALTETLRESVWVVERDALEAEAERDMF